MLCLSSLLVSTALALSTKGRYTTCCGIIVDGHRMEEFETFGDWFMYVDFLNGVNCGIKPGPVEEVVEEYHVLVLEYDIVC